MPYFDIALVLIILGFGVVGWKFGLVHTLGSLVGTIIGVYLATRWYAPVANWLIATTHWSANFSKVIVFIIVLIIINRLVGIAFSLVDKVLSIFTRLPIIHGINSLLGFIFGIAEGVLILGIVLYFVNKFPLDPKFMEPLSRSTVVPLLTASASLLSPFIPEGFKLLKDFTGIQL